MPNLWVGTGLAGLFDFENVDVCDTMVGKSTLH